ncbi:enoyl-CoA hydratase-related protein [Tianweitania sediminis]|uniref:Enoyl-CoA hydratase/isomerase family protein n=1 Tax=Tianweitania sediminis TaxID=1502156 RepID=A0A8J7RK60_9HYPH|nr:enoyl-CoA hydratase-related protein [Tianweitania sediminis]MBP0439946.1 enoyl-CoA hydratase/isomerase family protein [Tianweitania sediminis]
MSKILFQKHGHVALMTINRPEVRNAFDAETLCLMADTFEEVRRDEAVRALVVTGAGDKAFSAGADLGKLIPLMTGARTPEDESEHRLKADDTLLSRGILRGYDVVKPVIAAINGSAIAGGMELCQGTDIRIASETAKFGVQEVKWAIFPAGGSTVRLPQQLSMPRAMELLLTGDLIDANKALEWGFLNRVVPAAQVLSAAFDIAERIARNGPIAVQAIRRSARACLGYTEAEALAMELSFAAPVFASEDAREGPRSFIEKRSPVYHGR